MRAQVLRLHGKDRCVAAAVAVVPARAPAARAVAIPPAGAALCQRGAPHSGCRERAVGARPLAGRAGLPALPAPARVHRRCARPRARAAARDGPLRPLADRPHRRPRRGLHTRRASPADHARERARPRLRAALRQAAPSTHRSDDRRARPHRGHRPDDRGRTEHPDAVALRRAFAARPAARGRPGRRRRQRRHGLRSPLGPPAAPASGASCPRAAVRRRLVRRGLPPRRRALALRAAGRRAAHLRSGARARDRQRREPLRRRRHPVRPRPELPHRERERTGRGRSARGRPQRRGRRGHADVRARGASRR